MSSIPYRSMVMRSTPIPKATVATITSRTSAAFPPVVREHLRTHPFLGRERGEKLVADGFLHESVGGGAGFRRSVALHDQRARQRERRRGDPDPDHVRLAAATEILRGGKANRGTETVTEHLLGRGHRLGHLRSDVLDDIR